MGDNRTSAEDPTIAPAIDVIRGILERLPDEAARVLVLDRVLKNRCRKCLDYCPSGSLWCCYDSRGC